MTTRRGIIIDPDHREASYLSRLLAENRWIAYTAKDVFEAQKLTDGMSPDLVSVEMSPDYGLSPLDAVPLAKGIWQDAAIAATARSNPTILKSALKAGVDFTLTKPVNPTDVMQVLQDAALVSDGGSPRPHVMVIDDAASVRRLIGSALQKAGFRVSQAEKMEDALARIAWDRTDAAVVDVFMPGMGGIEGLRWLSAAHPDVVRIAISGGLGDQLGPDDALKAANKIGAQVTFKKPFDVDHLIDALRTAIEAKVQPSA